MRYWDGSALLPLIVAEPSGRSVRQLLESDTGILACWNTRVEMASAIARREREGLLSPTEADAAFEALRRLAGAWEEVAPGELIRSTAQRLLRTHPLRAADSLQLAAALSAAGQEPGALEFVCLDERLSHAARREGFRVAPGASGQPPA